MLTCDRCEKRERQSGYRSVSFSVFSQFTDRLLLHIRLTLRRRGITVPRNSLARCNARHLRIRRLVQFIFAGAVYHNALSNCAALLCRTQRRVARMCSRTLSDPENRLRKTRKKKSPAAGRGESPRSAERNSSLDFKRKTSRPERDEHAYAVRVPRSAGAEKSCRPERA